jgi:thiamine pyrophosphate-dependent acetolactate synthase large subunit-like protein
VSAAGSLDRRRVVARLLQDRRDAVVVTGLGSPTYDVAAAGDVERNFYLWGAMGGAAMVGLGLALARPELPVIVVTGDGEMLMGLGAFATIAVQAPSNLRVIVLDNGLYGETGAQRSHTAVSGDLTLVAAACGISETRCVTTMEEVQDLAKHVHDAIAPGPMVAVIKVSGARSPGAMPSWDGPWLKSRFQHAIAAYHEPCSPAPSSTRSDVRRFKG